MRICVVGLGYVGLPTAIAFHESGHEVSGIDISLSIIENLKQGKSHLIDDSIQLEIPISSDRWSVSNSFANHVPESDLVIITVPTPTLEDKTPDLSFVNSAMDSVLANIDNNSGTIVILESTVYPGVTRKIAENAASGYGLEIGKDFEIAYSPERVSPGDEGKGASEVPRIVGADSEKIGSFLEKIYSEVTSGGCTFVGEIEIAEASKMVENTQRDIDIAFVNELAKVLPEIGLDVIDVLNAASTKWNFHKHNPGIGVGGHCIPVDPYYYIEISEIAGTKSTISPAARKINESMPKHAIDILESEISQSSKLLILGVSYKANVGDMRESPIIHLVSGLIENGHSIVYWDPLADSGDVLHHGAIRVDDPYVGAQNASAIILGTSHDMCMNLDWEKLLKMASGKLIFDGPRSLNKEKMRSMGWKYLGIGVPR